MYVMKTGFRRGQGGRKRDNKKLTPNYETGLHTHSIYENKLKDVISKEEREQ